MTCISKVAIIDFGSQFTQLIARRIRELNVYAEIFCEDVDFNAIKDHCAYIFSGGPGSVDLSLGVPSIVKKIMKLNQDTSVPILGICYGLQIIACYFKSKVITEYNKEFGRVKINIINDSAIMKGVASVDSELEVWMSHFDSISSAPQNFCVIAESKISKALAIIADDKRKIYGLQFHPEVSHTTMGSVILSNFLDIAVCTRDWVIKSFLNDQYDIIKEKIGHKRVIAAVSGGVDSSVAVALLSCIVGEQLHCIFIDNGLLRKNEAKNLQAFFSDHLNISVLFVDASNLFLERLSSVTDSEEKRRIIGQTFIEIFEKEAAKVDGVEFLLQGTIYPDVIESVSTKGTTIKTHHNVGGLPNVMNLKLIEPLRFLFKDEVRSLGRELSLSDEVIMRHPFPGPGLAVRIMGEVTKEKVEILQEVDEIYIQSLKDCGFYDLIWQAFAVLLPVKTVGVMGDSRSYGYVCVLRAVTSVDGMTADCFPPQEREGDCYRFWNFLKNVSNSIINNVSGVNRVVYDITSKPPATIEWE